MTKRVKKVKSLTRFFDGMKSTWGMIFLIGTILSVGVGAGIKVAKIEQRLNTAEQTQLEQAKLATKQGEIAKDQEEFKNKLIDLVLNLFHVDPLARTTWKQIPGKPIINTIVDSTGKPSKFIAINQPWVEIENLNNIIKYEVIMDSANNLQLWVDTVFSGKRPKDTTKHVGFGNISKITDMGVIGAYHNEESAR
jgi:hypothetical protein